MRERQQIAQKIAVVKRTINGLALLYGAELPCWSREIYAILKEEFHDLVRQPGNHYESLVAILTRLVKYGEAKFLRNGSRIWQRPQSVDRRSA